MSADAETVRLVLREDRDLSGHVLEHERFGDPFEAVPSRAFYYVAWPGGPRRGILWHERFGANALDAYEIIAGTPGIDWAADAKTITCAHGSKTQDNALTGAALLRRDVDGDVRMRLRVKPDPGAHAGVVVRARGLDKGYALLVSADHFAEFVVMDGAQSHVLWSHACAVTPSGAHDLELIACRDTIIGWIDGTYAFARQDKTHHAGRAGLAMKGGASATFTAFDVETVEPGPISLGLGLGDIGALPQFDLGGGAGEWLAVEGNDHAVALVPFAPAAKSTAEASRSTLLLGDRAADDLDFAASIAGTGSAGVVFRHGDDDNCFRVVFGSVDSAPLKLIRRVQGSNQELPVGAKPLAVKTHHVRVRAVGAAIDVFVDGQLVWTGREPELLHGRVGVWSDVAGVTFDDMVLVDASRRVGPWNVRDAGDIDVPSRWHFEDGRLHQRARVRSQPVTPKPGQAAPGVGTIATLSDGTWRDVRVEAALRADDGGDVGIVWRYTDESNHCRVVFHPEPKSSAKGKAKTKATSRVGGADAKVRVELVEKGVIAVLAQGTASLPAGRSTGVTLDAVADRIVLRVAGSVVIDVKDPISGLSAGQVGFYTHACAQAAFSNIVVSAPPVGAYALAPATYLQGGLPSLLAAAAKGKIWLANVGGGATQAVQSVKQTLPAATPFSPIALGLAVASKATPPEKDTQAEGLGAADAGLGIATADSFLPLPWSSATIGLDAPASVFVAPEPQMIAAPPDVALLCRIQSGPGVGGAEIHLRRTSISDYLALEVDGTSGAPTALTSVSLGEAELLWSAPKLPPNKPNASAEHRLAVVVEGSDIRAYLDSVPLFRVQDATHESGGVALVDPGDIISNLVVVAATAVSSPPLLRDRFDYEVPGRWTQDADSSGAPWTFEDGSLRPPPTAPATGKGVPPTAKKPAAPSSTVLAGSDSWTDVRVSARFELDGTSGTFGVALRVTARQHYRFEMTPAEGGKWALKLDAGESGATIRASGPLPASISSGDASHLLVVEMHGPIFRAWLDGLPLTGATGHDLGANAVPGGRIGLFAAGGATVRFPDVVVEPVVWTQCHRFGFEDARVAGTHVLLCDGKHAMPLPAGVHRVEVAPPLGRQHLFDPGLARLRVRDRAGKTLHDRWFQSDRTFVPCGDAKILRNRDGSACLLFLGAAAGDKELSLIWRLHRQAKGLVVLSQDGDTSDDVAAIEIPRPRQGIQATAFQAAITDTQGEGKTNSNKQPLAKSLPPPSPPPPSPPPPVTLPAKVPPQDQPPPVNRLPIVPPETPPPVTLPAKVPLQDRPPSVEPLPIVPPETPPPVKLPADLPPQDKPPSVTPLPVEPPLTPPPVTLPAKVPLQDKPPSVEPLPIVPPETPPSGKLPAKVPQQDKPPSVEPLPVEPPLTPPADKLESTDGQPSHPGADVPTSTPPPDSGQGDQPVVILTPPGAGSAGGTSTSTVAAGASGGVGATALPSPFSLPALGKSIEPLNFPPVVLTPPLVPLVQPGSLSKPASKTTDEGKVPQPTSAPGAQTSSTKSERATGANTPGGTKGSRDKSDKSNR